MSLDTLNDALKKTLDEWQRQKALFPALAKDGWMDLALTELRLAVEGATAAAARGAPSGEKVDEALLWAAFDTDPENAMTMAVRGLRRLSAPFLSGVPGTEAEGCGYCQSPLFCGTSCPSCERKTGAPG